MYKSNTILASPVRLLLGISLVLSAFFAVGCRSDGSFVFAPYRMEIVQGNFISKEQAALIEPGMTRNQVRTILGTPLLIDIFHDDRWDYIFSIKRRGVKPLEHRVSVFFANDVVAKVDIPTELLTEEEFVEHLEANKVDSRSTPPNLKATPEQLERAALAAEEYRAREAGRRGAQEDARPSSYYPPLD